MNDANDAISSATDS